MSTVTHSLPPRLVLAGAHPLAPFLARLRARRLDRWLAHGIEPWRTPVLAARARQLTSERNRRSLARCLERLAEQAEHLPGLALSAVMRPPRPSLQQARPLLMMLSARLRAGGPVDPHGVAALTNLLTDGSSQAYTSESSETFTRALHRVERRLDVEP